MSAQKKPTLFWKSFLTVGSFSFVAGAFLFWDDSFLSNDNLSDFGAPSSTSKRKQVEIPQERVPLKQLRYKRALSKESDFPKQCSYALDEISFMTKSEHLEMLDNPALLKNVFDDECRKAILPNKRFQEISKMYSCEIFKLNEDSSEQSRALCYPLLFALKALAIAETTHEKEASEMLPSELAAHAVRMFLDFGQLSEREFSRNFEVMKEFYEQNAHDPAVGAAYIGYLVIAQKILEKKVQDGQLRQAMQELQGKSFEVDKIRFVAQVQDGKLEVAKKTLEKLSSYSERGPDLEYYWAAYHWKTGRRESAIDSMNRAISISREFPDRDYTFYEKTMERLQNAKMGEGGDFFSLTISLDFQQF